MPENAPGTPEPHNNLPAIVPARKAIPERSYVDSLTIRLKSGERLLVPANEDANRAANQVVISKLRKVLDRQLALIEEKGLVLEPKMMSDLVVAIEKLVSVSSEAYGSPSGNTTKSDGGPGHTGAIGRLAGEMIAGAVRGAVEAKEDSLVARMRKIDALGKKMTEKVVEGELVQPGP